MELWFLLGHAIDKSMKNVQYRVRVITGTDNKKVHPKAIPAISTYNNFIFTEKGITAWKAYKIGTGKLIHSSTIPKLPNYCLKKLETLLNNEPDFHNLPHKVGTNEDILTCPNDGCTLSFPTFHKVSIHIMFGKCEFAFQCQSSNGCDVTKKQYYEKMSKSFEANFTVSFEGKCTHSDKDLDIEEGWALKMERKSKRFNENQRKYLTEKFNVGVNTGRKEDQYNVSESMIAERKKDGSRRFSYDDILSLQQVTSFFSRMSRKNKMPDDDEDTDVCREETIMSLHRELTEAEQTLNSLLS